MKKSRITLLSILIMSLLTNLPATGWIASKDAAVVSAAASSLFVPDDAQILAVTFANELIAFDADNPGLIKSRKPVTGLRPGEQITAMENISNGLAGDKIIATTNYGVLFEVDCITGNVGFIVAALPLITDVNIGLAYNPATGQIHISNPQTRENVALDPDTGAYAVFGRYRYVPPESREPLIVAQAFRNNSALYGIDSDQDTFTNMNPQTGEVTAVGNLGVNMGNSANLDIGKDESGNDRAFATDGSTLWEIDLTTGQANQSGVIGGAAGGIAGLAVVKPVKPKDDEPLPPIYKFEVGIPGASFKVIGVEGEDLGDTTSLEDFIEFEPGTPNKTASATSLEELKNSLKNKPVDDIDCDRKTGFLLVANGSGYSVIETTSDSNGNTCTRAAKESKDFLIEVDSITGKVTVTEEQPFHYRSSDRNAGRTPNVEDMAYGIELSAGVFAQSGDREPPLYVIDSANRALAVASNPSTGELETIADFPWAEFVAGFDIGSDGKAFAVMNFPGQDKSWFYEVDLETGDADKIGTIGGEGRIKGLTFLGPPPFGPQISVDHVRGIDPLDGAWDVKVRVNENGEPVTDTSIDWEVIEGPNQGKTGTGTTDNKGEIDFTYPNTSGVAGTDTIIIRGASEGQTFSYTVSNVWTDAPVITNVIIKSSLNKVKVKGFNFRVPVMEVMINRQMVKFSVGNDTTMTLKKTRKAIGDCSSPPLVEIFADGFESGDLSSWSAACP